MFFRQTFLSFSTRIKKLNVLALKVFSKAFLFSLKAAVISPEETKRLLVTILRREEGVRKCNCP